LRSLNAVPNWATCRLVICILSIRLTSRSIGFPHAAMLSSWVGQSKACLLLVLASLVILIHASHLNKQDVLGNVPIQQGNDRLGAVASENKVCSQIGIDLLKAGGNAVDGVGPSTGSLSLWLIVAQLVGSVLCIGVTGRTLLRGRSIADVDEA